MISDKVWLFNPTGQAAVGNSSAPGASVSAQDYIPKACPQNDEIAASWPRADIPNCVYAMLDMIDVKWGHFQDELMNITSQSNFAADLGLLGIGAAGSFVSGGATQILHAASAGVTGLRASVNQDLLYSHTITTIILQMQQDRAAVRTNILDRLKPPGYTSIYDAANDLYTYARAGSWTHALLSIQASAVKSNGNTPDNPGKLNSPANNGSPASLKLPAALKKPAVAAKPAPVPLFLPHPDVVPGPGPGAAPAH